MKRLACISLLLTLSAACSDGGGGLPADTTAELWIDTSQTVVMVDERYLSVAVDTAQVVGGRFWSADADVELIGQEEVPEYDFSRPRLRALASELSPAFLRIGGTDADRVIYDMSPDPIEEAPEGFEFVLTAAQLDGVFEFAETLDYDVMFTLSAGRGTRNEDGEWTPTMARELVQYVSGQAYEVTLWELGNEWDTYFINLDLPITPSQVVADFAAARVLLEAFYDDFMFGGVSSAYWPSIGEITRIYPDFLEMGGGDSIEVITWHYYPQQSERGGSVRSDPWERGLLLDPARLDIALKWADEVAAYRDMHAPGTPIWLGESGHAQYGGQPGSSDRYEGTFWWLDQLGALARRGQQVSVRQTLSGSNYGLIDDVTLEPRPDYWASVLWRRLMGQGVLDVGRKAVDDYVRVYAHCAYQRPGAVTLLAINLDADHSVRIEADGLSNRSKELYLLTSDALDSADLMLNGTVLRDDNGTLPVLDPDRIGNDPIDIPPRAMAFIVYPDAEAVACERSAP
jgi:heparanase 1